MRKLVAVGIAALTMAPSLTLAAGNHPMAGCGLGYVLLGVSLVERRDRRSPLAA